MTTSHHNAWPTTGRTGYAHERERQRALAHRAYTLHVQARDTKLTGTSRGASHRRQGVAEEHGNVLLAGGRRQAADVDAPRVAGGLLRGRCEGHRRCVSTGRTSAVLARSACSDNSANRAREQGAGTGASAQPTGPVSACSLKHDQHGRSLGRRHCAHNDTSGVQSTRMAEGPSHAAVVGYIRCVGSAACLTCPPCPGWCPCPGRLASRPCRGEPPCPAAGR